MSKKKQIFFIIPSLISGGAQRTFLNILNRIDTNKFNCTLVVYKKEGFLFRQLNKKIKVLSLNSSRSFYSIFKLAQLIRTKKPDIVFSTLRYVNFTTIISVFISCRKPKIIIRETNNHTAANINESFFEKIIDFSYHYADKIIALSKGVSNDIKSRTKVKKEKIKVIYNPINIDFIEKEKKANISGKYAQMFSNKKVLKIINIGHLQNQKGQDLLIKAVSEIKGIPFYLFIVGEGEQRNNLENLIDKLGLRNKVFLLGFQRNPYKFLSNSDIFVLSSRWEGFGHVIVEAMATGTTVISTNCRSGPSEIIKNNYNGVLCRPNNVKDIKRFIVDLYKNKRKRRKLIKNAHKRKMFFEDKIIIKQYEHLFSQVL